MSGQPKGHQAQPEAMERLIQGHPADIIIDMHIFAVPRTTDGAGSVFPGISLFPDRRCPPIPWEWNLSDQPIEFPIRLYFPLAQYQDHWGDWP